MVTKLDSLPNINIKEVLGFVPSSIWNITKSKKWTEKIKDFGENKPKRKVTNKFLPGLKYSSFNPDVAEAILKYWSKEGELILDPFAGRSTRAFVALSLNRQYIGYDVSQYAIDHLNNNTLIKEKAIIYQADGCELQFNQDKEVDLIFTCPPYFNLEKYESAPNQLTDLKSYDLFIDKISKALLNCYRVLKDEKYCIWVVGDFRINKEVKAFHIDVIEKAKYNGFKLHDIVIEQIRSPFIWCRVRENYRLGITAKAHQYILIFKK